MATASREQRAPHKLVDMGLCGVVQDRLAGVLPCALRMTEVVISQCPDTAVMSVERCAPYEQCTFAPQHSFTYQPGTVSAGSVATFTCVVDTQRATATFVAACVATVALFVLIAIGAHAMSNSLRTPRVMLQATLPRLLSDA